MEVHSKIFEFQLDSEEKKLMKVRGLSNLQYLFPIIPNEIGSFFQYKYKIKNIFVYTNLTKVVDLRLALYDDHPNLIKIEH
jgi:hypothetical protein